MKKYIRQILIVLIVAVLTLSVLASCGTATEMKYTVSFIADGKVVKKVETKGYEAISVPDAPEKENYEFVGWYLDENVWSQPFTAEYFADKATVGNVNVYARYVYIAPTYTVTFDTDGGEELSPVKVSVIDSAPVTTREGYDFDGWYLDPEFTQRVSFPFTVEGDCTLYAKWVAKTVTFIIDEYDMISGISGVPEGGYLYIPSTVG